MLHQPQNITQDQTTSQASATAAHGVVANGQVSEAITPLTVTALSQRLKNTIEKYYPMVCVEGEIWGSKQHSSGHFYCALKDEQSLIDGVCWRGSFERLTFKPQDGQKVTCWGRITTYQSRSKYQLVIERMTLGGRGQLLLLFERLKNSLRQEGFFDEERKRALPHFVETVGVITSATGSVLHDMMRRFEERFIPRGIALWPTLVQGEGSIDGVIQAIEGLNRFALRKQQGAHCEGRYAHLAAPSVIILARGGGGFEDLWTFNEERVVRAIAASAIPIISAIGHETDITLSDFVADYRASTPTAAAAMVAPLRSDLASRIAQNAAQLVQRYSYIYGQLAQKFIGLTQRLLPPRGVIELRMQRLDEYTMRLNYLMRTLLQQFHHAHSTKIQRLERAYTHMLSRRFESSLAYKQSYQMYLEQMARRLCQLKMMLDTISPLEVLKRGFSVVTHINQPVPAHALNTSVGDTLCIQTHNGTLMVLVSAVKTENL